MNTEVELSKSFSNEYFGFSVKEDKLHVESEEILIKEKGIECKTRFYSKKFREMRFIVSTCLHRDHKDVEGFSGACNKISIQGYGTGIDIIPANEEGTDFTTQESTDELNEVSCVTPLDVRDEFVQLVLDALPRVSIAIQKSSHRFSQMVSA